MIPLASLAAILLAVGYKLAKPALFKQMHAAGPEQFVPYMVTVLGIVFTDLLVGIGIGLSTAIVYLLWNNYKTPYHRIASDHPPGAPVTIALAQEVSFLNKASIMQTLHQLPDNTQLTIDGRLTSSIHPDVIEIIEDFRINSKDRGITVEVVGLHDRLKPATSTAAAASPATAQTAGANGRT
jgi:MFS superfamily sulfate permease-like transporter